MIEHYLDEIFTIGLERAYDNTVEVAQATYSAMLNMLTSKIQRAVSIHMDYYSLMLITHHYKFL